MDFGVHGAMEARGIDASCGALSGHGLGEVEKEDGVLVIKRIHAVYHLEAAAVHAETIARVHGFHAEKCPVYRTISGCVDITTEVKRTEPAG